jgi:hypothetical protein
VAKKTAAALIEKYQPKTTYSNQGPRCQISVLPKGVPELVRDLRARTVTYKEIARIVNEEYGTNLGLEVVGRHLKGECRCGRGL